MTKKQQLKVMMQKLDCFYCCGGETIEEQTKKRMEKGSGDTKRKKKKVSQTVCSRHRVRDEKWLCFVFADLNRILWEHFVMNDSHVNLLVPSCYCFSNLGKKKRKIDDDVDVESDLDRDSWCFLVSSCSTILVHFHPLLHH